MMFPKYFPLHFPRTVLGVVVVDVTVTLLAVDVVLVPELSVATAVILYVPAATLVQVYV